MRCRVNDLAFIRKCPANPPSVDLVVKVIRFVGNSDVWSNTLQTAVLLPNVWVVEYDGSTRDGHMEFAVPDDWLTPIRDASGDDQTLEWAPVPREVEHA